MKEQVKRRAYVVKRSGWSAFSVLTYLVLGIILGVVGLGHKSKNYPKELSGGEQQRVALARALANNPKTIIADEPTGNVDPALAREIMELLIEINKMGTTVVTITHDKNLVDDFNKRVIALKNGQIISDTTGGYNYNEHK